VTVSGTHREPASEPGSAQFATTHWSVVLAAQQGDSLQAAEVLEKLCRTYWYPLYVFIRRSGHDEEAAKDLTQSFLPAFSGKKITSAKWTVRKASFPLVSAGISQTFSGQRRDRANTSKRGGDYAFVPWAKPRSKTRFCSKRCRSSSRKNLRAAVGADLARPRSSARLRRNVPPPARRNCSRGWAMYCPARKHGFLTRKRARLNMTPGSVQVAVHRLRPRYGELLRAEIATRSAARGDR